MNYFLLYLGTLFYNFTSPKIESWREQETLD